MIMAEFICHLKKYRQQVGLTQEQLAEKVGVRREKAPYNPSLKLAIDLSRAEKVGVRRETIMRLEKAQYNPSLKLAVDISRAVGIPIEEIFIF